MAKEDAQCSIVNDAGTSHSCNKRLTASVTYKVGGGLFISTICLLKQLLCVLITNVQALECSVFFYLDSALLREEIRV